MIVSLLFNGQWALFALIIIALVISLSVHEFGHAFVAKAFGDDTAQHAGRLTLNPVAHIDPVGLLMVMMVGFGYAKPVPTDPRNYTSRYAELWVAAAGPLMNLVLAVLILNAYALAVQGGYDFARNDGVQTFVYFLVAINLVLMIFNLIPLGPLDGHYILPYFLPRRLARLYLHYNARFGVVALLGLILLGLILQRIADVPVFDIIWEIAGAIEPYVLFV